MTKLTAIIASVCAVLTAAPALAASPRTFVSGKGSDTGTCAVVSPCRSFAYAITQTAAAGEILVLDSAGYGPVMITQAVNIVAPPGIEGAITAQSGANGITINAGTGDTVILRGLTIDGGGAGYNGIVLYSGTALDIASCTVQHFMFSGIFVSPSASTSYVSIASTVSSYNRSGIIFNATSSGLVKGSIVGATTNKNQTGISLDTSSITTVVDSIATNNNIGFSANNGTTMRLGRSVAAGNYIGVAAGGTVYSYGDNKIDGNTIDVSGSLSSLANR